MYLINPASIIVLQIVASISTESSLNLLSSSILSDTSDNLILYPEHTQQKANLIFKVAVNHTRRSNNPSRVLVNSHMCVIFAAEGNVLTLNNSV